MTERYVRPPLVGCEAPASWRTTWPFRVVLLLLVGLLAVGGVLLARQLTGATAQDPGVDVGLPLS